MKRASPLFIPMFVLACYAARPVQQAWQVENPPGQAIKGLVLESANEVNDQVVFTFRNVSDKPVTSLMSCFSQDGKWFGTCNTTDAFANAADDFAIAPGKTVDETLDARTATQCVRAIRVAIIYQDGSSEGVRHNILEMQASHLGRALESYRLNTLLSALDDPTDAKIRQFASRVGHKPKHEDLAAYDEFNHVQVSGVFVPDIKRLHRLHKAAFIESVTSVRNDMLAAIEQMQALPTSSQDIGVPSRSEYLSGLKEHMKERSSNLVNRYRRGQKGGLR